MNDQPTTDPFYQYALLDPTAFLEPPVSHPATLRARAEEIIMTTTLERTEHRSDPTGRTSPAGHRRRGRMALAGGLAAAAAAAAFVLVSPDNAPTAFADAVSATDTATSGRFQLEFALTSPGLNGVNTRDYRYDGSAYAITDEFSLGGQHVTKTIGVDGKAFQKFDDAPWKETNPATLTTEELAVDVPGRSLEALSALDGMQRCDTSDGFDVTYCTSTTNMTLVDALVPTEFTDKDSPDNPQTRSAIRADVRDGHLAAVSIDVAMTFATGSGHLLITLNYSELGQPQQITAPI
jgi:hypothetical protein